MCADTFLVKITSIKGLVTSETYDKVFLVVKNGNDIVLMAVEYFKMRLSNFTFADIKSYAMLTLLGHHCLVCALSTYKRHL